MRSPPSWIVAHGTQNSVPSCIAALTWYNSVFTFWNQIKGQVGHDSTHGCMVLTYAILFQYYYQVLLTIIRHDWMVCYSCKLLLMWDDWTCWSIDALIYYLYDIVNYIHQCTIFHAVCVICNWNNPFEVQNKMLFLAGLELMEKMWS